MFTLRQTDTGWEVIGADDQVLVTFDGPATDDKSQRHAYTLAVQWLADNLPAPAAPAPVTEPVEGGPGPSEAPIGALSDRWQAAASGIVAQAPTGDGRDFSNCSFTWRDTVAPLPLMLLTENEMGHWGAQVCGWIDQQGDPTSAAGVGGWFHDTDAGRQARDILLAQGAYSVSVDPGDVECVFECIEEITDEYGAMCVDGSLNFLAYEIAGLTMVPFPAFGSAAIELVSAGAEPPEVVPVVPSPIDAVAEAPAAAAVAPIRSSGLRTRPPAAWLTMREPDDSFAGYVQQDRDGRVGVPLTITDEGQVYAHAALWETCHIGYVGECVAPPASSADYAHFHLGVVRADDGIDYPTGALVAGCDHAALAMRAPEAADWYAHNGVAWADVRATNGTHGIWVAGALRPDVTPDQVRVLRAGSLSGDWRDRGGHLELVAALAVSVPGFPVVREAITASGLDVDEPRLGWKMTAGRQSALVASGVVKPAEAALDALVAAGTVTPCPTCGKRVRTPQTAAHGVDNARIDGRLDRLETMVGRALDVLGRLDGRTRHERERAATAARERLRG